MGDALDDFMGGRTDWPFPLHGSANRPGLSSERRHIEREMDKLRARLGELDEAANRFGEEPPVGTVITFKKRFPHKPNTTMADKTYSYAAIRTGPERVAGAGWYLTGRDGSQPRTWAWLTDFIGDGPFRVIAPEFDGGGKASFFNVLFDDRMPSNLVLIVDETGKTTVGVDPAEPGRVTMSDLARATRKLGTFGVAPEDVERPLAAPGESGYDPEKFEAATRAKYAETALEPFWAMFVEATINSSAAWVVRDRRVTSDSAGPGGVVVATFPADDDGKRRALQSVADRNRPVRREMLKLKTEPPVGARVRSVVNRRSWARREPQGWVRYSGTRIQGVRLSWAEVRRQLGRIEAGSPDDAALFVRQGER
jgi:hypothetical protein